jgi:hypothetical protein
MRQENEASMEVRMSDVLRAGDQELLPSRDLGGPSDPDPSLARAEDRISLKRMFDRRADTPLSDPAHYTVADWRFACEA